MRAGINPCIFANERYTITFNGEIYNYVELREQLASKGYQFKSDSDTEVLLALYAEYGASALRLLDGMFAFAIWDQKQETLFCARDRFGEKPFFYTEEGGIFSFASEMKQLWAIGTPKTVHPDQLYHFLVSGHEVPSHETGATFYKNIKEIPAAHALTLSKQGVELKAYWELDYQLKPIQIGEAEAKAELEKILELSIKRRLRSDVPVGSSLSGGLDSSILVTVIDALKQSGQKQKTFSARFKDFDKDEGDFIEAVLAQVSADLPPFGQMQKAFLLN